MKLKFAVVITIALPAWVLLSAGAIAMPLQPGAYSSASRYIQIAKKGTRYCYQGFSARGTFVSSLSPDPKKAGHYRLDGSQDLFIRQDSPTQISFGSLSNPLTYKTNSEFGNQLSDDMQQCLNSSKPYSRQQTSGR
jgi:hypothetical protein